MKKFFASMIIIVLLLSNCIIAAFPASAEEYDINYANFDIVDGVILEYFGSDSCVIVPSVADDGTPITKIDSKAFRGNQEITAVYICEGIVEIGEQAFEECKNLVEISLPYSLEVAGHSAFRNTAIISAVIPGNLKVVPGDFIVSGFNLQDLVISYGVEELSARAIYFFGNELFIPSTVYNISGISLTYVQTDLSIYIASSDAKVGAIEGIEKAHQLDTANKEDYDYTGEAPIAIRWNVGVNNTIKIYAPKEAQQIKEKVNDWESKYGGYQFIGRDQEFFDEKDAENKERSITKATKWQMGDNASVENPSGTGTGIGTSAGTGTANGTGNTTQVQNGIPTWIWIVIAAGVFFFLLIIAVVVIVVVNSNKKQKMLMKMQMQMQRQMRKKKTVLQQEPEIVEENLEEISSDNE